MQRDACKGMNTAIQRNTKNEEIKESAKKQRKEKSKSGGKKVRKSEENRKEGERSVTWCRGGCHVMEHALAHAKNI